MPEYMIVYQTRKNWALGPDEKTQSVFFEDQGLAHDFFNDMWEMYPNLVNLQMYDYTGIQYVIIERRHRDV